MAITIRYFSSKERKQIDRPEVYVVFWVVIFLFNQSKNNAVLEPRKEHLRGLVGFAAPAKEGHPQGQGRPEGLPTLVNSVEQEREQEVFIELDDFDDSIEENEDIDFLIRLMVKLLVLEIIKLNY